MLLKSHSAMPFHVWDIAENYFDTGSDQRLPQHRGLNRGLLSKFTVKVRCKSEEEKKKKTKPNHRKTPHKNQTIFFASHRGCVLGRAIPYHSEELPLQAETKSLSCLIFWSQEGCWAVWWEVVALPWMFSGLFQVSGWGSHLGAGLLICLPALLVVAAKDGARGQWWKVELSTPPEQPLWERWPHRHLPVTITSTGLSLGTVLSHRAQCHGTSEKGGI